MKILKKKIYRRHIIIYKFKQELESIYKRFIKNWRNLFKLK